MQRETGEVKQMTEPELKEAQEQRFYNPATKKKEPWWVVTKVEPTQQQIQSGVKGWHQCLCGSGKKFRDCCKVKTPYVKRVK
jgi:uncharacterized protein YchJ